MAGFILASASPRRLELLKQIGCVPDAVFPGNVDETPLKAELPDKYVLRVAGAKAHAVAAAHPGRIVLAADTAACCGRRILPKAETEAEARQCLKLLSGRRHRVYTGVALVDAKGGEHVRLAVSQVKFKRLTKQEIDAYVASGEWRGKAGGYAIQGRAAAFIPWISGSFDNVVGLPLCEVAQLLANHSIAG